MRPEKKSPAEIRSAGGAVVLFLLWRCLRS